MELRFKLPLAAIYDQHYFKRYGVTRKQVRLD